MIHNIIPPLHWQWTYHDFGTKSWIIFFWLMWWNWGDCSHKPIILCPFCWPSGWCYATTCNPKQVQSFVWIWQFLIGKPILFLLSFQIVGIAILAVGIWGVAELKYYLDLSETNYNNVPYMLIGTGSFMIVAGIIGCCSIIKNIAWLLRLVSILAIILVLF